MLRQFLFVTCSMVVFNQGDLQRSAGGDVIASSNTAAELIQVTLRSDVVGHYEAMVDIGESRANGSRTIAIELLNPTNRVIKLGRVQTTCGCLKGEVSDSEIKPNGRATITLTIQFTKAALKPIWTQRIAIDSDGPERDLIRLSLSSRIAAMLQFTERSDVVVVPSNSKSATAESNDYLIRYSAPVDPDELVFNFLPDTEAVTIKPLRADHTSQQASVKVSIDVTKLSPRGLHGLLQVEHPATGVSDSMRLALAKQDRIAILPDTILIERRAKESSPDVWKASALLVDRFAARTTDASSDDESISPPYVELAVGGQSIPVRSSVAHHALARLELTFPQSSIDGMENGTAKIHWNVRWKGTACRGTINSRVFDEPGERR